MYLYLKCIKYINITVNYNDLSADFNSDDHIVAAVDTVLYCIGESDR